jgi:hypothetical protein
MTRTTAFVFLGGLIALVSLYCLTKSQSGQTRLNFSEQPPFSDVGSGETSVPHSPTKDRHMEEQSGDQSPGRDLSSGKREAPSRRITPELAEAIARVELVKYSPRLKGLAANVELKGGEYLVTFPWVAPNDTTVGPEYYFRVKIDALTGRVVERLGG